VTLYRVEMPNDLVLKDDGGVKLDDLKTRFDLVPPRAETEMAEVLGFGARKYSADNWKKVPNLKRRYYAAARRHMVKWWLGEKLDEESGRHHLAHALCCLMFILEIELEGDEDA